MGPSTGLKASKPIPYKEMRYTHALPQTVRSQVYLHPWSVTTGHRSPVTSPANLSVAPLLPRAGHWYFCIGCKRIRHEAKT
jgi:hypothetical protein